MRWLEFVGASKSMWLKAVVLSLVALLFGMSADNSDAAGLLIADGGFGGVLKIETHDVKVTINNGVAVTRVTQVFRNTENRQVEALYTFPVPKGASVANFSMWINGKEMVGEVVEKKRAREIYESYKRTRRDPGLLEQVDYKTFEMRVFPINGGAEQKVQIVYYQELNIDHNQATYVYPLATVTRGDVDSSTTGTFAINVEIKSAIPITTIDSPSHGDTFVVVNHSDTHGQASLETTEGSLASDVVVHYRLAHPKTGLDLISSRQSGDDGYFLLTLTAGEELEQQDEGMDYVFVLDISGSMKNDSKLVMSKNSVEAFTEELGVGDRFEVMTFNVRPNTLFSRLLPVTEETRVAAGDFMRSQQARGGTVLTPAMTTAYKYGDPDRTLNVIILSDGMTEQKERQTLLELIQARPRNSRVFCIGVGNEVNRPLLEQMAEDSGGLAAFISRGDNFKRQAKAFRRKLTRPAASNPQITIDGVQVYDVEPRVLPHLYHGAPIRIYGRYSGSGEARVSVKADVQGVEISQTADLLFPDEDQGNPEIERMWAWKRVDQLLKKADRAGSRQQVIDEVIRLGEGYSIVTEYTSFLVLENDAEYSRWKIERRNALRIARDRKAQAILQNRLQAIRDKAVVDIGPQPTIVSKPQPNRVSTSNKTSLTPPTSTPSKISSPSPRQSRDVNFSTGSGPVGPFFLGLAYWLTRRKRRS